MPSNVIRDVDAVTDHSSPTLLKWMKRLAEAEVANDFGAKSDALEEIAATIARP